MGKFAVRKKEEDYESEDFFSVEGVFSFFDSLEFSDFAVSVVCLVEETDPELER